MRHSHLFDQQENAGLGQDGSDVRIGQHEGNVLVDDLEIAYVSIEKLFDLALLLQVEFAFFERCVQRPDEDVNRVRLRHAVVLQIVKGHEQEQPQRRVVNDLRALVQPLQAGSHDVVELDVRADHVQQRLNGG